MNSSKSILVASFAALTSVAGVARATVYPQIYWSDRGSNSIHRADADGSNVELIASADGEMRGLALDLPGGKVYWSNNGSNKIQRSNLDGTQIEDLVTENLNFPADLDLDLSAGKIYWADRGTNKIQRADLDGGNVEDLVVDLRDPYYLDLDFQNELIYWSDFGSDKIQRANFDGTNVQDVITTGLQTTRGVAVDVDGGKLYWSDRGTDKLQRSNLNGSAIEDLVPTTPPPGVDSAPHGVALDTANNHMYWLDNGLVTIERADLDGSNRIDILTADTGPLERPWDLELVFAPADVPLQAGDANQDLSFDQLDLVQVLSRRTFFNGASATWGSGDWDGAPGGSVGSPPMGDGQFNQLDIIAALNHGLYLTGPYGVVAAGGVGGDSQTSIGYSMSTGELWIDAPKGTSLTSINIESAAGIFTAAAAANLGGSFDNDADANIFKATFGSSFGSLSFGNVASTGLSREFLMLDLSVVGSLEGGGGLGDVDLIYVPEPSGLGLCVLALLVTSSLSRFKAKSQSRKTGSDVLRASAPLH